MGSLQADSASIRSSSRFGSRPNAGNGAMLSSTAEASVLLSMAPTNRASDRLIWVGSSGLSITPRVTSATMKCRDQRPHGGKVARGPENPSASVASWWWGRRRRVRAPGRHLVTPWARVSSDSACVWPDASGGRGCRPTASAPEPSRCPESSVGGDITEERRPPKAGLRRRPEIGPECGPSVPIRRVGLACSHPVIPSWLTQPPLKPRPCARELWYG